MYSLFVSLSLLCGSIKLVYYSPDSIRCEAGKRQSRPFGKHRENDILEKWKKVFEMVEVDAGVQVFTAAEGRPKRPSRLNLQTYWIRDLDHATYTWDPPPRLRRRRCLLTWHDPVRVYS